jgi:hypothetical protein
MEEGVQLLELAQNAQRLSEKQEAREKRRLLDFMVSNCTWRGRKLAVAFRQPFDFLQKPFWLTRRRKPPALSPTAFLRFGSAIRSR